MGGVRNSYSNSEMGKKLSSLLTSTVGVCRKKSDQLSGMLNHAINIDKIVGSRVDFGYKVFGDIIEAASYSIPMCGSTVQKAIRLFRNANLKDAWWLVRTDASNIGMGANGFGSGYGNGIHSPAIVADVDGNTYRNGGCNAKANDPWWRDGKPGGLMQQCEGDVVAAASDLIAQCGGSSAAPGRALAELGMGGLEGDWNDVLAISRYMQILSQLQEVAAGGVNALLPFVLGNFASKVSPQKFGLSIAEVGGIVTADGKFAMGEDQITAAKKTEEGKRANRIALGYNARKWGPYESTMISAQRKLIPSEAEAVYVRRWGEVDRSRINEILLFKTKITAYRKSIEDELAQLEVGEMCKTILDDTEHLGGVDQHRVDYSLDSHGFGGHSAFYKATIGRRGVLRVLGNMFTLKRCFRATGSSRQRAEMIVDFYIIYKIFELHLGTPWLASLAGHPQMYEAVAHAMADAVVTVVFSKAVGPDRSHYKRSGRQDSLESLMPEPGVFLSPTISAFWSPIAYLASRPYTIDEFWERRSHLFDFGDDRSLMRQFCRTFDGIRVADYAYSVPCWSKGTRSGSWQNKIHGGMAKYIDRLGNRQIRRTLFIPAIVETYRKLFNPSGGVHGLDAIKGNGLYEQLIEYKRSFADLMQKATWVKTQDDTANRLTSYTSWVGNKMDASVYQTVAQPILQNYQHITLADGPYKEVLSAYYAQKAGIELMVHDAEDPKVAIKLMHDTMRLLLKKVMGVDKLPD